MATDDATSPVARYEASTGGMLDALPASIGIGSQCRGLTLESGSGGYLWVSNTATDELYRVHIDPTGVEPGTTTPVDGEMVLRSSANPIQGSIVLEAEYSGFGAVLSIYDISGRSILTTDFNGSFCWNTGNLAAGTYLAQVRREDGVIARLVLTRL